MSGGQLLDRAGPKLGAGRMPHLDNNSQAEQTVVSERLSLEGGRGFQLVVEFLSGRLVGSTSEPRLHGN